MTRVLPSSCYACTATGTQVNRLVLDVSSITEVGIEMLPTSSHIRGGGGGERVRLSLFFGKIYSSCLCSRYYLRLLNMAVIRQKYFIEWLLKA